MKLYLINELGYEYNDETYERTDGDFGKAVKAFKNKENAEAEMKMMTQQRISNRPDYFYSWDGPITEYYTLSEVEVADEDVMDYKAMRKKIEEDMEKSAEIARTTFYEGAKQLFAALPKLKSFSIKAYTDYFNDGEDCKYCAHVDEPDINGKDGCDLDSGKDWNGSKVVQVREPSIEYVMQQPVREFLQQFASDDMYRMFGDHVMVTMKRGKKKVDISNYTSHD